MRTTLTVDDNIMEKLKEEAFRSGVPLKQVVNTTLEIGLRNLHKKSQSSTFVQQTYSMGSPTVGNMDKALTIASTIEDEEVIRKVEMGK